MKIKKSAFVLLAATMIAGGLTSCGPKDSADLRLSVQYQKSGTGMKYASDDTDNKVFTKTNENGYTHKYREKAGEEAKSVTYHKGDWKPTWAAIQKNLDMTFEDVTDFSQTKIADAFKTWQTKSFEGVDIAQGSTDNIVTQGTSTPGSILDLSQYLDRMPNFKAFLEKYPAIEAFIKNYNGAMYYAPYFDGFDDIERMLMVRFDWVKYLLDCTDTELEQRVKDTNMTITSWEYEPWWDEAEAAQEITVVKPDGTGTEKVTKTKTANVITLQESATTPLQLVKTLRDYIDNTYGGYYGSTRSNLFIGQNACYDVDELVALFRVVRSLPKTLTGQENASIVPLYPRDDTNDRIADLWRFTQFFGVRGGESRNGYLYVDKDGKLNDARDDSQMLDAIERMNQMSKEGLILKNFATDKATGGKYDAEHRKDLLKGNTGFATYDYNQTTTILNKDINTGDGSATMPNPVKDAGIDPLLGSCLPAVAKWDGEHYSFFTESWRSVKTEGWFIVGSVANDEGKLEKALKLFDYLYSEEGNRLMSYGPDTYLEHDAEGKIVTIDYQGKDVPKLSAETLEELDTLASGNYTNYYRYWLGATLPSGYVKEQGMEYQTVVDEAKPSLNYLNKAIEHGVLKHVNFNSNNTDKTYNIVPTTLAYTQAESNQIANSFNNLNDYVNNTKGKNNAWSYVVMNGWGGANAPASRDAYLAALDEYNLDGQLQINNTAYARQVVFLNGGTSAASKAVVAIVPNKQDK